MANIWVKAMRLGYYGMARRRPAAENRKADVFEIEEKEYSDKWMKKIRKPVESDDDELPDEKPVKAGKGSRPSDESKF